MIKFCKLLLGFGAGFMYVDSFLFRVHKTTLSALSPIEQTCFLAIALIVIIVCGIALMNTCDKR